MQRKKLTKEELRNWMNNKLQEIEGCNDCNFSGITPLRDVDENGCNW